MATLTPQEKAIKRRGMIIWVVILGMAGLAAVLTYIFLTSATSTTNVLVAAVDIPPYTAITEQYLEEKAINSDTYDLLTQEGVLVFNVEDKETIIGQYAEIPIKKGEMLYRFKFTDSTDGRYVGQLYEKPGYRLVAITASILNAGAGQLKSNDYIDIYYDDEDLGTTALLRGVKILDIKYGNNPFLLTPEAGENAEQETTTENSDISNINPSLNDTAYIIFALPEDKATPIIDSVLTDRKIYFAASRPIVFHQVESVESTSVISSVIVADVELPYVDTETGEIDLNSRFAFLVEKPLNFNKAEEAAQEEGAAEENEGSKENQENLVLTPEELLSRSAFITYSGLPQDISFVFNGEPLDYQQFIDRYMIYRDKATIRFTAKQTNNADKWDLSSMIMEVE